MECKFFNDQTLIMKFNNTVILQMKSEKLLIHGK